MVGVRVQTCRQTRSRSVVTAHSVVTSQSRRRPNVESSRSAGGSSIGASATISINSVVSSDQRCSFRSSRDRKTPTITLPASGWSNMLSTSSVWTWDPSARLMTGAGAGRGGPRPRCGRTPRIPARAPRRATSRAPDRGRNGRRETRGASPRSPSAATLAYRISPRSSVATMASCKPSSTARTPGTVTRARVQAAPPRPWLPRGARRCARPPNRWPCRRKRCRSSVCGRWPGAGRTTLSCRDGHGACRRPIRLPASERCGAPARRCVGDRLLRRRVAPGAVTDRDTHEARVAVHPDGNLELGCRILHRVRGELREHQDEGVRAVAAAGGQRTEQEASGSSDRRRGGREEPETDVTWRDPSSTRVITGPRAPAKWAFAYQLR